MEEENRQEEKKTGSTFCGTGCVFAGLPKQSAYAFYLKSLPSHTLPSFLAACRKVEQERSVFLQRVTKPSEPHDFVVRIATRTEEDEEGSSVIEWSPTAYHPSVLRVWKKVTMQEEWSSTLFANALSGAIPPRG
jgi:hypothetical protein